jgi:UDP-N-acetylglucosamine 2-epimerase (non-hydrolysing)
MRPDQSLNEIVCRVLPLLEALYVKERPRLVLVQGDTTSAFCAGLAAFHGRVAVGHVEAGLRSFNRFHPYPEEANRRMLTCVTDLHLAATPQSADNLLREGVRRDEIVITGNTVIDSLLETLGRPDLLQAHRLRDLPLAPADRLVLITLHRRENWMRGEGEASAPDSPLEQVLAAVAGSARAHPAVHFVYPVHRNPRVQEPARRILGGLRNVHLLEPVPYIPFVDLLARAAVILTDSGGIQEEAPSLGVPVLVARETTERPEGVAAGSNRLVGTRPEVVMEALGGLLENPPERPQSVPIRNPFGDGHAAGRVRQAVLHYLELGQRAREFDPGASLATSTTGARSGGAAARGGTA